MGQTRVTESFVSAVEASEILGQARSNVAKTLERHGVPYQTLVVGKRSMKVFLRDDVERVRKAREKAAAKRSKAKAA